MDIKIQEQEMRMRTAHQQQHGKIYLEQGMEQ